MRVLCDKQLYLIEAEEEEPPFLATLRIFSENFFVLKHFPILTYLSSQMPQSWAEKLIPGDHQFRKVIPTLPFTVTVVLLQGAFER